ncbi:MAG TPA: cation diffusion facilitator family transporter, partial [Candidatus Elarobacter sp.]|nr:cation diffusion facilitator family transporter [Candidatus Elarobacter sp.]
KLIAGVVGHAYALVADAVESTADIFSSLIVIGGLHIAAQPADENHPYGHGRAEALAGAVVSLMLIAAAIGIAIEAIREIRTPHHAPKAWTLVVLVGVMVIKQILARRVSNVAAETGSRAVMADAQHHHSDAITSAAAFIGISIAVIGGPGWEPADDWAALVASGVIAYNGVKMLRPAIDDLMDRMPDISIFQCVSAAATSVEEVCAIEKLKIRKIGLTYAVDLHVQADPRMSLHDAHIVSGKVKGAIKAAMPAVDGVHIHMEPFET